MAGEIPTLTLTVNLETSGVQAGVVKATADVKKVSAEADKAASRFANLKTVMVGTFAGNEMSKGLHELEGFLKESVQVAEEAQTSITELATAMNNAKVNTDGNRQTVDKITESMMNLGFTGNSTREALTKLVTATGSVSQAQKMMGVAADYARLKHMSLNEAATVLSRGTVGAVRAFREYGITLDSTLPKNQAIAKAFEQLNAKIGGQAAAYAETYAGKLAILSVKTNDLKEKVGTLLLPVLTKLSSWFIGSLEWITKHHAVMEALAALIGGIVTVVVVNLTRQLYAQAAAWIAANAGILLIVTGITAVAAAFVWAWNKFDGFRHGVVTGVEAILDTISFLLKAIGFIAEAFLNVALGPLHLFLKVLGLFSPTAKMFSDEVGKMPKTVGDFFDSAANKVTSFKKTVESVKDTKIKIDLPDFSKMLATAGGQAGADPGILGQTPAKVDKAAAALAKKLKTAQDQMLKLQDEQATILKNRQDQMDVAKSDYDTKVLDATTRFNQAREDIAIRYQDSVDTATTTLNDANEKALQAHQDNLIQIQQASVDKQKGIIQQSIDVMTSGFANVTKFDLSKLFSQTGTTSGLIAGMQYQLKQILQLQKDAGALAAQGYSQEFINQVIAQGPMVGDQMAQTILNATPETANQIKSLYTQIDTVSNAGLDKLATTMNDGTQFATSAMAKQYAQVAVDLQKSLADENIKYQDSLDKAQASFNKAISTANNSRDLALKTSQDSLTNSLTTAQQAYDKSIQAISDSTMKQLDALQTKITETAAKIASLGGTSIGGGGAAGVAGSSASVTPTMITAGTGYISSTGVSSTSSSAGTSAQYYSGASGGLYGSTPTVTINAPITVDGSTSAIAIQNKILQMTKYGIL